MDSQNIPKFEIPKSAETREFEPGQISPEQDRTMGFEGTKEILPAPAVVSNSTSSTAPLISSMPVPMTQPIASSGADDHLIADDVDVIEKEWVERAKQVIKLTSHDPHLETKELSKLKATYIKKRFNKDIPLAADKGNA